MNRLIDLVSAIRDASADIARTATEIDLDTERAKATAVLVMAKVGRKPQAELIADLQRIEFAIMIRDERLKGSSDLPFVAPLSHLSMTRQYDGGGLVSVGLTSAIRSAIGDTVNGRHELWFTLDGHAMLSMEFEDDALMFALMVGAGSG